MYDVIFQAECPVAAQQYIPEDTVLPEHILAFHIGAVAPFMINHRHPVHPGVQVRGQVKSRRVVTAFAVTYIPIVTKQIQRPGNAQKGDGMVQCGIFNFKFLYIHAHRAISRNLGRFGCKGIARVYIVRLLIAGVLPSGGHRHGVHLRHYCVQICRQIAFFRIVAKAPVPGQTGYPVRRIARSHRGALQRILCRRKRHEVRRRRQQIVFVNRKVIVVWGA